MPVTELDDPSLLTSGSSPMSVLGRWLLPATPMTGAAPDGERSGHIDPDGQVALYRDADQPVDSAALAGVLALPKTTAWSGTTVGAYDPFDGVWLNLTVWLAHRPTPLQAPDPQSLSALQRTAPRTHPGQYKGLRSHSPPSGKHEGGRSQDR